MGIVFIALSLLFAWGLGIAARGIVTQKSLTWPHRLFALATIGCFAVFLVGMDGWMIGQTISMHYGGYTHLGKIDDGRHFVGNKGSFREVTPEQWKFLQKTERIFGEHWGVVSSLGMLGFFLMLVLGKRLFGESVVKIGRLKNMKWEARSSDPPLWWFCDDGAKEPFVEITGESCAWHWKRHSSLELDGIGPAEGDAPTLQSAQLAALNGIVACEPGKL